MADGPLDHDAKMRAENRKLKAFRKEMTVLSETSCSACDYEEADGSLFRHCDECMLKIVSGLWQATHGG